MTTNSFILVVREGDSSPSPMRYDLFVKQLFKAGTQEEQMIHAALGIAGEAGEVVEMIKKRVIYGKPLDVSALIKELGDIRFYLEALSNTLDIAEQDILQVNANKLSTRYKDLTYSSQAAISRIDVGLAVANKGFDRNLHRELGESNE